MIWSNDILNRPLFEKISTESIAKLLRTNSIMEDYETNEIVFRKGEDLNYFCIVVKGLLKSSEFTTKGKEISSSYFYYLKDMGRDYAFAIDAFPFYLIYLGHGKHTMDTYAVKNSTIIKVPVEELMPIVESDPVFMKNVLTFVSKFAYYSQVMLKTVEYRRIEERLAYWMLEVNESQNSIRIPYSQEVLAGMLHVNRSTLNQELGRLREEELITISNKRIIIKDVEYFKNLI